MLTTDRIANAVSALDDGQGVRLSVSTLNEKCGATFCLDHDESSDVRSALSSYDVDQSNVSPQADELGAKYESEKLAHGNTHKALANAIADRAALQARVDTLTAGERLTKDALAAAEKRATDAEAARERTFHTMDGIVKERNEAWERKEKAEKRNSMLYAAAVLNKQALDAHIAESERLRIRAEKAEADRDEALTAYQAAKRARDAAEQSEAATAEGHDAWKAACEKAEARVKVLEGDAVPVAWMITLQNGHVYPSPHKTDVTNVVAAIEPLYRHPPKTGETVAWDVVGDDGMAIACDDEIHANKVLGEHGGRKRPLYEAPPPAAVDVSHIRTLIEHGKQGCYDLSSFVIVLGNMLDKLPTVDVQTIRETCVTGKTAVEKWGKGAVDFVQFLDVILAAIGEKGG